MLRPYAAFLQFGFNEGQTASHNHGIMAIQYPCVQLVHVVIRCVFFVSNCAIWHGFHSVTEESVRFEVSALLAYLVTSKFVSISCFLGCVQQLVQGAFPRTHILLSLLWMTDDCG